MEVVDIVVVASMVVVVGMSTLAVVDWIEVIASMAKKEEVKKYVAVKTSLVLVGLIVCPSPLLILYSSSHRLCVV